jgi:ribosomal protein S18 acetylase RimI-like enzyme
MADGVPGSMELLMLGPDDAEELSEYARPIWLDVYSPLVDGGRERVEEFYDDWMGPGTIRRQMSEGFFFAYLMDGSKRLGFISAGIGGETLEINKIYIDPEARGKGYGSQALAYILGYGRENGCKKAVLEVNSKNEPAISLYEKNGFVRGERTSYVDSKGRVSYTLQMLRSEL